MERPLRPWDGAERGAIPWNARHYGPRADGTPAEAVGRGRRVGGVATEAVGRVRAGKDTRRGPWDGGRSFGATEGF